METYADCTYEEGRQDCILGMVKRFREAKMSETTILDMMVKGLGTSAEEIRRYMAQADKEPEPMEVVRDASTPQARTNHSTAKGRARVSRRVSRQK